MARQAAAPGSRRGHSSERRELRLTVWFTEAELGSVRAAAAEAGMAPAAWLGKLGTDAAGSGPCAAIASRQMTEALAVVAEAAELARRHGYLLNQAVARLHSTGEHDGRLAGAADLVARAVTRMEDAVLAAARALRPPR